MNLRRETISCVFLTFAFVFSSVAFSAPEPEMDEVIDLTKIVKPKKENPKSTKRESQESQIENQVNEYGEGGSGLKAPKKKETVGEQLSTIEEKKPLASDKSVAPPPPVAAPTPEVDADIETSEQAEGEEPSSEEEVAPTEEASSEPEEIVEPEEISESAGVSAETPAEEKTGTEAKSESEGQADLEVDPDPVSTAETPSVAGTGYFSNTAHGQAHHECTCAKKTQFEPYKERRQRWAGLVDLGTSFYSPTNYESDFAVGSFENVYGSGPGEAFELSGGVKLNLGGAGAIALLVSGGQYKKTAPSGAVLSLTPVTIGAKYYLDTLFREPYVVPYFGGGAYTLFYKETLALTTGGGNVGVGFYYSGGLAFQLDWMDEYGDLNQYEENAIENTFLYVEARGIMTPLSAQVGRTRDFSNTLFATAGLRFEF